MTPEQVVRHLRRAQRVAQAAVAAGRHPFGALLVALVQDELAALHRSFWPQR